MNKKQLIENWSAYKEQIEKLSVVDKKEDSATQQARISKALNDYQYFCEYYFPHLVSDENGIIVKNGLFHNKAANYIKNHRNLVALFEWARGHAKSTQMTLLIPLWLKAQSYTFKNALKTDKLAIKPQFNNMVLVGKSEESAIALLGNLQAEIQYNERYIHDFGVQYSNGSWESGNFQTKDSVSFRALGRGQSPRGLNYKGKRPDYIVPDDIDDDELCRNASRVDELFNWLVRALFNTMDMGRGRFMVVGNRISKNSIIARAADIPGIYHSKVNALTTKGEPTWSEKYTIAELDRVRTTIGNIAWEQEFMNNPIVKGAVFKDCNFKPTLPWHSYANIVCYTDPSFKNTATSDFKALVVMGQTKQGEYHVLKANIDRVSVTKMIDWHYEIERQKPENVKISYYMEANFAQDILVDEFYKEGDKRGYHIPLRKDERKKPDKYQRIENLEPLFSNGRVWFSEQEKSSPGMKALVDQFLAFQKGSRINDDGPDAVEGAINKLQQKGYVANKIDTLSRKDIVRKNRF
jgi:predicted phage terminase large subunit-like protein